jgi:hypothetical protein
MDESRWRIELLMNIHSVRALSGIIDYFLETWPGSPARPAEEQVFALDLKYKLKQMLMEHSFEFSEAKIEKKEDPHEQ